MITAVPHYSRHSLSLSRDHTDTVSGGLFSVAYTDVVQGAIGWTGCLALAYYLIANEENQYPPVSIGFPGYVYPDASSCEMYDGVACSVDTTQCCYNAEKWCPSDDNCRADVSLLVTVYIIERQRFLAHESNCFSHYLSILFVARIERSLPLW
jgi:hypothetical protein